MSLVFPFITAIIGIGLTILVFRWRYGTYQQVANDLLHQAEKEADDWLDEQKRAWRKKEAKQQEEQHRLDEQKRKLEQTSKDLNRQATILKQEKDSLQQAQQTLSLQESENDALQQSYKEALATVSGTTPEQARRLLQEEQREVVEKESSAWHEKRERELQEDLTLRGQKLLATAIQRLCVPATQELSSTSIPLPKEEMKSWIIGREGRNIRAFERSTGVNLMMDESPGVITVSAFDPFRRAVAKSALKKLLDEGRIFPARIEEVVEEVEKQMEKEVRQRGEDAATRIGAYPLHPKLYDLLGNLHFRTSLGQNVLDHSIEVAQIMGLLASELGLDVRLAKRIGLLHDIGKAIPHSREVTHAKAGHDLALECEESAAVANGIGCHHHEMEPLTVEGSLCHTADAISASRPGARSESWSEYVRRIEALEEIAASFPGVEKAYVLQAGKEIVVIVGSDAMNDQRVRTLAREITKKIEQELRFPGKIKVTVIREKRVIHYTS